LKTLRAHEDTPEAGTFSDCNAWSDVSFVYFIVTYLNCLILIWIVDIQSYSRMSQ
jgi:hypothetical protein